MSKPIKIILFHAVSLSVAILFFASLLKIADGYYNYYADDYSSPSVESYSLAESVVLANLNPGKKAARKINFEKFKAAAKNDYLLFFGSSEVRNLGHKFIPYNFFPKQFGIPVFAYGHAYFELLGTLGMLSSIEDELTEKSKILIIISPGWFESVNLYPQAFVEHFPDDILKKSVRSSFTHSVFKKYLSDIKDELTDLTETQRNILGEGGGSLKSRINSQLFNYRQRFLGRFEAQENELLVAPPPRLVSTDMSILSSYDWEQARQEARNIEFGRPMSEKTGWVKKDYFEKYLNSTVSNTNRKITYSHPENELWALEFLSQFLESKGIRALFVMQSLNPLYYKDMQEFDPINEKVASILKQYNQYYLDLYSKDVQPALLTDIMHMGELGWVMINEEITRIFYQEG